VPSNLLTTASGKPGLEAEYEDWSGIDFGSDVKPKPITSRVEPNIDLTQQSLPAAAAGKKTIGVEWKGELSVPATGDYMIGLEAAGFARVALDGKTVSLQYGGEDAETRLGRVHLVKGEKAALEVQYRIADNGTPHAKLIWSPVNDAPSPEVVTAARNADLVIAAVGITSRLEGEEMPVNQPGFLGGDRTSLDLPQPEEALVEAVAATGKPLVVVLMNGSALGVNWIDKHANAVLEAWYPGEEGGAAIAETLSGKNNPAGRLPVTFYKDVSQLPNFEDYTMENRTYRYFSGKPLYPFGYGLSYSSFGYTELTLEKTRVNAGDPVIATVTVTNTGKVAGDEVAEVYLKFPAVAGAPRIALRGFKRVHLEPGQSQQVRFELKDRDLSMVTDTGQPIIASGDYTISVGGGQPDTAAPSVAGHFHVDGQIALPE
jgi:beta-glucosidase